MGTSVVVCTRNRAAHLLTFSHSLFAQRPLPSQFVIIDASTKPLDGQSEYEEIVRRSPIPIAYRHVAPGLPFQRNIGIDVANGDIVHFFDDDVVLLPGYLAEMERTYQTYPDYAGGMGTVVDAAQESAVGLFFCRVFGLLHVRGDGRFYRSGFPRFPHGAASRLTDTEVLSGFLMSFRRGVLEEYRFDERLGGYAYLEDVDFSWRVSRRYRLFFNPAAKLEHRHAFGRDVEDRSRARRVQFLYNHRYLFMKNRYPVDRGALLAHWWSIVGLFAQASTKGPTWVVGYVEALRKFQRDRMRLQCH